MITPQTPKRRMSAQFNTPQKKRHVTAKKRAERKSTTGADHNDKAQKHVSVGQQPKKDGPTWANVVNNVFGLYRKTFYLCMRQANIDAWSSVAFDDNGNAMEFFTPRKFKDCEAVSFNGKPLTANGYATETVAIPLTSGVNLQTMQPCYVQQSWVQVNVRNVSQHSCTLQMFICYGNQEKAASASTPFDDFTQVLKKTQGNNLTNTFNDIDQDPMNYPEYLERWKTEKVEFKFEPGERGSHKIQGPAKYILRGDKHSRANITATTSVGPIWLSPEHKGNGCIVWFRMLNDITLVAGTTGTANSNMGGVPISAHHPVNLVPAAGGAQGGVIVEFLEYIKVKAPDAFYTQPSISTLRSFLSVTGTLRDIQVDADDSSNVPAAPL